MCERCEACSAPAGLLPGEVLQVSLAISPDSSTVSTLLEALLLAIFEVLGGTTVSLVSQPVALGPQTCYEPVGAGGSWS